jgi:hypothetical protein
VRGATPLEFGVVGEIRGGTDMKYRAKFPMVTALMLISFATLAVAQSQLENMELCNGADRSSPDPQISGCTALIESASRTHLLSIAYINRGAAYIAKGDYDRAIQVYDLSI